MTASTHAITHRSIDLGPVTVFYREAGDPGNPTLLLLHGFPTSSHMFRDLIPLLADRFHLVAPDLPGFGFTTAPDRGAFDYGFDGLARVMTAFTEALGLARFALYVFDYGAPVGFRLALAQPERVTALISQNGNAYEAGLGEDWAATRRYWQEPTAENRAALRPMLSLDGIRRQYTHGVADQSRLAPEAWWLDYALVQRPGNDEIQLDLFGDYASNIRRYLDFQAWLRHARPPVLLTWGRHDPFFIPAGAEAFRADVPDVEIHMLDTGHFALETHAEDIAGLIADFMTRRVVG
ncbi:alpha/beta hydrolase (plasmid) [Tistrella mobilis]|uniref:alpha/beta fold hydrolase n=1 Tax=Tistrella mobilis TaxID=171437 RepID=UPI0035567DE6